MSHMHCSGSVQLHDIAMVLQEACFTLRQCAGYEGSMHRQLPHGKAQNADLNVVQDICKPCMHSEGLKHLLAVQQRIHHLWVVPQA